MSVPEDPSNGALGDKVSRLPPLPAVPDPALQENFETILGRGGQILNLHRVSGHAPRLARARGEFVWALRDACLAERQMRELVIVQVAHLMDCQYELDHHLPMASRAGLNDSQLEALPKWGDKPELFAADQRALLAYIDAMFHNRGAVDDDTFNKLALHFSPQEIVELTMCATSYYGHAFFLKALRVEIDRPDVKAAPGRF